MLWNKTVGSQRFVLSWTKEIAIKRNNQYHIKHGESDATVMRTYDNFQRYYQHQMDKNRQSLTEAHKENHKLKKKWDKGDIEGGEDLLGDCAWLEFENIMIGADPFGACVNIKSISFHGCTFDGCRFSNCIFTNCSFSNCYFINTNFTMITFENCMMNDCDISWRELQQELCMLGANFIACRLDNSRIANIYIDAWFEGCILENAVWDHCVIRDCGVAGCELDGFGIVNSERVNIKFSDQKLSTVGEKTFIDYRIKKRRVSTLDEKEWYDYLELLGDKAATLHGLASVFEKNGLANHAGEYYYQAKSLEYRTLPKWSVEKFTDWIKWALCGYGERPSHTFFTIVASTLFFAVLYFFGGIDANGYIIDYSIAKLGEAGILQIMRDYGHCLFFSVTTFSTVGYGNYVPLGAYSSLFAAVHMITGVGLCALWTGCIFRKLSR